MEGGSGGGGAPPEPGVGGGGGDVTILVVSGGYHWAKNPKPKDRTRKIPPRTRKNLNPMSEVYYRVTSLKTRNYFGKIGFTATVPEIPE